MKINLTLNRISLSLTVLLLLICFLMPLMSAAQMDELNLDVWLTQHSFISETIRWEDFNGNKAYSNWSATQKADLLKMYRKVWNNEPLGLIDPPPNIANPADAEYARTVLSKDHAWPLFLAHVAHSLVVETGKWVSWSLTEYSQEELLELFDGSRMFRFDNNLRGYELKHKGTPAPPDFTFDFLDTNNIVAEDRLQTIGNLLDWCRSNMIHFLGGFNAKNMEGHWQYRGLTPISLVISGTTGVFYPSKKGDTSPPRAISGHYTAGCWGTTAFLRAVLRVVNIPVKEATADGHALPYFMSEGKYLSHGDDPYGQLSSNRESHHPHPFPVEELFIDQSTYNAWFGPGVTSAGANVGRRPRELAIEYLPRALLTQRCRDIRDGNSHADSRVYRWTAFNRNYSVADLEATDLWNRIDTKINRLGGCAILTNNSVSAVKITVVDPSDLVVDSPQVSKDTLAPGESFTFSVTVRNEGGGPASATTLRYYRSSDLGTRTEIGTTAVGALASNGTSDASIQLAAPTAPDTYFYFACIGSVTRESNTDNNCTPHSVRITVQGTPAQVDKQDPTPHTQGTTQPTPDLSERVAALVISSGNHQQGIPNSQLAAPLIVQVLDADSKGVANASVTFHVTTGQGRFASRETGRTLAVSTNTSGFSEVPFTPTSAGTITIQASVAALDPVVFTVSAGEPPAKMVKVSGDNQTGAPSHVLANPLVVEVLDAAGDPVSGVAVVFEVTAGGGQLSTTTTTTNTSGRAQTTLTLGSARAINTVRANVTGLDPVTFNTHTVPKVDHVAAMYRPVMYWIDSGTLYRLAGTEVERITAHANDVAVDMTDRKIYWIEGTSDRAGRIHSANVDGTGATVVKELTSVPMGLALDSANGKLYLTNNWGKIQRINVNGTGFEDLIVGLGAPMDIAISSGGVYWTDAGGSVRYANMAGTKIVRNIATGSGALGGIAAGSNKVYWTEQTGTTTGRIRSANLDGSGIADLFSLTAVPAGIAVDGNTVYWANGWGKVQRRNIDRSKFQDLVTGLMAPGAVAIGGGDADATAIAAAPARGVAAPDANLLLPNYPNPFNPETWIPYQLSKPTDVTLTIYAVDGQVVRHLKLGHQAAGRYQSRSRAAYWNGRNAMGEPVASGLYFYTLTAGDFTTTRKMLILK